MTHNYANPAIVAMPAFKPEEDHFRHVAGMELHAKPRVYGRDEAPFKLFLDGYGFEATRDLTLYDIEQLRDWCDRVLTIAKAGEKETA